ncbi:hypothetical protein ABFS82_08G049600 [Erythranthe guttata]
MLSQHYTYSKPNISNNLFFFYLTMASFQYSLSFNLPRRHPPSSLSFNLPRRHLHVVYFHCPEKPNQQDDRRKKEEAEEAGEAGESPETEENKKKQEKALKQAMKKQKKKEKRESKRIGREIKTRVRLNFTWKKKLRLQIVNHRKLGQAKTTGRVKLQHRWTCGKK